MADLHSLILPITSGGSTTQTEFSVDYILDNLASAYSTSAAYAVGDYVIYNGDLYKCTTAITVAEAWTTAHWTQVTVGEELGGLKEDLDELRTVKHNYAEEVGHLDGYKYWKRSLPIDWSSGSNTYAWRGIRVLQGSTYYLRGVWAYFSVIKYDSSSSLVTISDTSATQNYNGSFVASGDGYLYVTSLVSNLVLVTDSEDLYNSGTYNRQLELCDNVFIKASQVIDDKYSYINVKPNGGGDFTTIKSAFDSITNPSPNKRYVVNFYGDGTEYNLLNEVPFSSGQAGLKVPPFTKLIGIGGKEKNILVARLSELDGTYSPINLSASSELEGLTIIGYNTRYTIHDDFYTSNELDSERTIKNCRFVSEKTYYRRTYGAGIRSGCKWNFINCIFDGATTNNDGSYSCHNNTGFTMPTFQYFENCRFNALYINTDSYGNDISSAVRFGSITTNANGIKNHVKFVGCKIQNLFLNEEKPTQTGTGILFDVSGYGNDNFTRHILNTDGVDYSSNIDVI